MSADRAQGPRVRRRRRRERGRAGGAQARGAQARDAQAGDAQAGRFGHVYGALDLGTNNCRLLVARPTAGGFRVVDAFSRVVQLGEGLGRNRALSEPAMRRTLDALGVCAAKLRRRGVDRLRAVATEACRRAGNAEQFVARVKRETGLALEIIPPAEEARLAIAGCLPLLDRVRDRALIFDIGGGSTQIVWLAVDPERRVPPQVLGALSAPIGVVSLSEEIAHAVAPGRIERETRRLLTRRFAAFCREHGVGAAVAEGRVQMIGASGTVTTLAGVDQGLARYDRARVDGAWIDFPAIERLSAYLAALDPAARAAHPCVGRDRSDLVLSGCLILGTICEAWPVGRLRVADRGLREGVLMDLMAAADRGD